MEMCHWSRNSSCFFGGGGFFFCIKSKKVKGNKCICKSLGLKCCVKKKKEKKHLWRLDTLHHVSCSSLYLHWQFCFSFLHLPWIVFPTAKLYLFPIYYVSHILSRTLTSISSITWLNPFSLCLFLFSMYSSIFIVSTRGHWYTLSRPSLSEVWCPHAWMAEWNRQLHPCWGPSDF